jgi:pimeloyl-ACP methyl ester carboxylesterase
MSSLNFSSKCKDKCPVKKGFVVRTDGDVEVRLFFRLEGDFDPNDAVVLFVHSAGTDSRVWRCQQKTLCPCYPTLSIDLRGFGQSSKPAGSSYSYDMFADDIKVVLDTLSIANVIYVGSGMGSGIGVRFANKYPGYIVQMALSGLEPLYTADRADWPFSLFTPDELQAVWAAIQANYAAFAQQFATTLVFPDNCTDLQTLRAYSVQTTLNTPQNVALQIIGFNNPASFIFEDLRAQVPFLNNLKIPILLLSGTQAGAAYRGSNGVAFTQLITSEVYIYEFLGKGINANATDVNRYNTVLVNFLRVFDEKPDCCDVCKEVRPDPLA